MRYAGLTLTRIAPIFAVAYWVERPLGAVGRPHADAVALADPGARSGRCASASTSRSSSAQVQRRPVANSTSASRSGWAATVRSKLSPIVCSSSGGSSSPFAYTRLGHVAERTPGWSAVGRVCRVTSTDTDPVESEQKQTPFKAIRETVLLLAFAIILALVVKTFFVQSFYIPSESMEPGLIVNDRILVQKPSYWGSGGPQRGDVIVFDDPGGWLNGLESAPADVAAGARAGQDRPLPDRRPPGEAGDRRRRRHHRVLRRPGPDHGQRRSPSTRTTSSSPRRTRRSPATARCPAARWTATGPRARCRPARCS